MAFPVKQVWISEERLHIIEEVEKTPSQKRTDVAKQLSLPPSTLNFIIAKKREIRDQAHKCGTSTKKRKMGKESTYSKLVPVGPSIRHTCGWENPAVEIPQNSCNNGD
jgi:hypothetical protein